MILVILVLETIRRIILLFGLKFAYETMSNELNPFDYDTFYKSHTKVLVGVTNANTGKAEYNRWS